MTKKLLQPDEVRVLLKRRYENQVKTWLVGEGVWPLVVSLGAPTEKVAISDPTGIRAWVGAWASWKGLGDLAWIDRQWGKLGEAKLPSSIAFKDAGEVAAFLGELDQWRALTLRYERLIDRWPSLTGAVPGRLFSVVSDYADADFVRLFAMLDWLECNPASGLSVRQLPVEGVDTKWLESRKSLIAETVSKIRDVERAGGFHDVCGLSAPPTRVRLRVLCPKLRDQVGGLCDIEAPVEELAALPLRPELVFIVENLETGLALPQTPSAVALMKLGHAVELLEPLRWLSGARCVYWGDIDTHGFVILSRVRAILPRVTSILMDEKTLLAHRSLWGEERAQSADIAAGLLSDQERSAFDGLKESRWGLRVRLEQERIPWRCAHQAIMEVTND